MSTGRDELLWAVVNYDTEHPDYEELSDIGEGQYLCSVAADLIQELRKERDAAQAEARELRAELARVREALTALRNAVDESVSGTRKFAITDWTALIVSADTALSQPAEQRPDQPCPTCDGTTAYTGHPCGWCAANGVSKPAAQEALPLMARETAARMIGPTLAECVTKATEGGIQYLIADTDEHGLPVIQRTADMPEGATHKITWLDDGKVDFTDCAPMALEANRSGGMSERIEDYNGHGQEGRE